MKLSVLSLVLLALVQTITIVTAQGPSVVFFAFSSSTPQNTFLGISFDAAVSVDCDPSGITFHPSATPSSNSYTLNGGACAFFDENSEDGLQVMLLQSDAEALLSNPNLCSSELNCFYTMTTSFTQGADNTEIVPTETPTPISQLIIPSMTVNIVFSSLDLDTGQLTINCDEFITYVNVSILEINKPNFSLQFSSPASYTPMQQRSNISIPISDSDVDKVNQVVENPPSTNWTITFPSGAITADNGAVSNYTQLSLSIIRDGTSPELQSFTLDMNSGSMSVTFNELMSTVATTSLMYLMPSSVVPSLHNFTLDGSNVSISDDQLSFDIVFTQTLFTDIQADEEIGSAEATTFLYLDPQSFFDISNNPLATQTEATQVTILILESDPPSLNSFTMSVDTGELRMTFSEPMSPSSLNLDQITLIVTVGYQLTLTDNEMVDFEQSNTLLIITLSPSSLNELKLLFFESELTFLSMAMSSDTITDSSNNHVTAIPISSALAASDLQPDSMHPTAAEFAVVSRPPQSYALNFTFNEYMNVTSFDITQLTLILETTVIGTREYTGFGGGKIVSSGYTLISYELSTADLAMSSLQEYYQIAYFTGNISVYYSTEFIKDLAGNIIDSPLSSNPTVYSSTETDPTPPELQTFSLNLASDTIQITFNENVVPLNMPNTLRLINAIPIPTTSLTLNSSSFSDLPVIGGNSFTLSLESSDVDFLLGNTSIATGVSDTYLFVLSMFGVDMSGNLVQGDVVRQASEVILPAVDSTSAALPSTTSAVMSSSVSSSVLPSVTSSGQPLSSVISSSVSIIPSSIVSSGSPSSSVMISSSVLSSSVPVATSSVPVATSNVQASSSSVAMPLSSVPVASSSVPALSSSVPVPSSSVPVPSSSVPVASSSVPVPSSSVPVASSSVPVPSSSVPVPSSSVPVASSSVPVPSSSVPVPSSSVPVPSSSIPVPSSSVPVASSSVPVASSSVSVPLSSVPVTSSSMISVPMTTSIVPSTASSSIPIVSSTSQSTSSVPPSSSSSSASPTPTPSSVLSNITLELATLDLGGGYMQIVFSDTVLSTDIGEQGDFYLTNTVDQITITDVTQIAFQGLDTIIIIFSTMDLNTVKLQNVSVGWQVGVTKGAILDMDYALIQPQLLEISSVSPDTSAPSLLGFDLDMDSGQAMVTYTEPINHDSINVSKIYLTKEFVNTPQGHRLSDSTVTFMNQSTIFTITFSSSLLNEIKLDNSTAVTQDNSYIFIEENVVADLYGNVFPVGLAQAVNTFQGDVSGPSITSFELDLNSGSITLTFNEPIKSSTFNLTASYVSMEQGSDVPSVTLEGSVLGVSNSDTVVSAGVSTVLNDIKYVLRNNIGAAYLTVTSVFVSDVSSNTISDGSFMTDSILPDTVPPMATGITPSASSPMTASITFDFNEYMDVDSFDVSQLSITIENTTYDMFASGTWTSLTNTSFEYDFTSNELSSNGFGTEYLLAVNNGQLSVTYGFTFATDLGSNSLTVDSPLVYQANQTDETPPIVSAFELDTDAGTLILTFSEAVIIQSLTDGLQLQNRISNPTTVYALTSAPSTVLYGTVITVSMSANDTANLINVTGFANTIEDTFLLPNTQLAIDYSGNVLSSSDAIQAASVLTPFTPDPPPVLISSQLDLNSDSLELVFNRAILHADTQLTGISINNGIQSSTVVLTGGVLSQSSNDSALNVELLRSDVNSIKYIVATAQLDTFNVTIANNTIFNEDNVGNEQQSMVLSIVEDETSPQVESFSLDMDSGVIAITFSEPMSNTTYNTSEIWLSGTSVTEAAGYQLVNSELTGLSNTATVLTITIDSSVLNMIKADISVAVSVSSSNLFVTQGSFNDISDNPVSGLSTSLTSTEYSSDVTSPVLDSFSLDLDIGRLHLTFDEPVNVTGFKPANIKLHNSAQTDSVTIGDSNYMLSNDDMYSSIVTMALTSNLLNSIKALIGTSTQVYISMPSTVGMDTSNNMVEAITDGDPVAVSTITPDTTPPELLSLTAGDENDRTITLTFTEFVQPSSWDGSSLTLILKSSTGSNSYSDFTDGSVSTSVANTVTYTISNDKFQPLLSIHYQQAYYSGSIGVTVSSSLIEDIAGNSVDSVSEPLYYTSGITDPGSPQLSGFDLDLDSSTLVMTFNEPVLTVGIPNNIKFQNTASLPSSSFVLSSSSYSSQSGAYGAVITVTLSSSDVLTLASDLSLGNFINDTFLVVESGLALDYSGNSVSSNSIGVQASSVMPLTGPINPTILSFDLDLDSDQLTLHFDTPVDVATFVAARVTLVNESSVGVDTLQIQLSNTTVIAQSIQTDFRILLSTSNIIDIKRHPLCYTEDNCFATFTEGVVISEADLPSKAVTKPLKVDILHQDVTPPRFLSFPVFDLNSGFFAILFTEPVNGSSTDFTEIQFGNSKTSPSETVSLTSGFTSPDHVELDFHLTNDDLNQIKYHLNLCTKTSNCWLRLPSFVISDIGSNPYLHSNYQPGADASFHSPTVFVPDKTSPTLNGIAVDMHLGVVRFLFDEVIDDTDFIASDITLLNEPSGELSLVLSNITEFAVTGNGTELEVYLTQSDHNWIKSRNMFSTLEDSYVSLVTSLSDVSGNVFVNIAVNEAKQATQFTPDTALAELVSFELFNIDNGSLILSFNEPMNDTSFNPSAFSIVSDGSGSPVTYSLTSGLAEAITKEQTLIMITLSLSDRVAIKLLSGLATSSDDTYIALGSHAIQDRSDNSNKEVAALKLKNGQYVEDTSPASLSSAIINMNNSILMLIFDDVVNADELVPSFITIQNQSDIALSISYMLDDSTVSSDSSNIIDITISTKDTLSLKTQLNLAKSIDTTFISFTAGLGKDIEGRPIIAVANSQAIPVSVYYPDSTSPELISYNLDMDSGEMVMTFSEPVLLSSFTPNGLRFQDVPTSPTSSYTLKIGGVIIPQLEGGAADTEFTLQINSVDLNEVKSNANIATEKSDTFIWVNSSFITDTSGNPIKPVYTGMNVVNYLPDVTLPTLVQSWLDMTDGGKLIMQFSEAVQYTDTFLSTVRIQNSLINPSQVIVLVETGNSVTKTDLHELTVTLSNANTNKILNDNAIASSTSNAFISLVTGGVYDYSQGGVGQSLASVTTRVTYMYITCFEQNTYNNIDSGTCDTCSSVCVGGCTGSGQFVGEGGCGLCAVMQVDDDLNQVKCLPVNSECPDTHYMDSSVVYTGLTSNGYLCRPCHQDCSTCSGAGPQNCDSCQSALQLNGAVIVQCLTSCSPDSTDCSYCHSECNGCFGAGNTDCIACKGDSQTNSDGQTVCVPSCTDDEYLAEISGEFICIPCHKECIGCTGPSNSDCKRCQNFNNTLIAGLNECSPRCLFGTYADGSSTCQQCHAQCDGCTGPSSSNCTQCVEDTLSVIGETVCVPTCPLLQEYNVGDRECTLSSTGQIIVIAVSCSVGLLVILLVSICAICCVCKSRKSSFKDSFGDFDLSKTSTSSDKVSFIRSSRLFHTTSKL